MPNRQLWWSSPISGPRRYEYVPSSDDSNDKDSQCVWVCTRHTGGIVGIDVNMDALNTSDQAGYDTDDQQPDQEDTLIRIVSEEIFDLFGLELKI